MLHHRLPVGRRDDTGARVVAMWMLVLEYVSKAGEHVEQLMPLFRAQAECEVWRGLMTELLTKNGNTVQMAQCLLVGS